MKALITLLALFAIGPGAFAEIVVTPPAPTVLDSVTLRLQNQFGAEASVASATITQVGNTFVIVQNVNFVCTTPSNPLVASNFAVGPLPPGLYTVTATINFIDIHNLGCGIPPRTQTITFLVAGESIPALGSWGLWVLAVTLAGVVMFKWPRL